VSEEESLLHVRQGQAASLDSKAVKEVLEEIQVLNEGTGDYFAQEEQRLLVEIAKQREAVREERARGIFSRDGNEPTMARYKLNRLEFLLRRLREDKASFERRREHEEKEINRLGLVAYLKTYTALKSFGYPTAYELLAKIVDPEGYGRLLARGLSVKDIDIEELCNAGRVVIQPGPPRKNAMAR
jgi:hypothetical protein